MNGNIFRESLALFFGFFVVFSMILVAIYGDSLEMEGNDCIFEQEISFFERELPHIFKENSLFFSKK